MNFFAAKLTKNTGQRTLEGAEVGSGDEMIGKKRTMTKKGRHHQLPHRMTPTLVTPLSV